MKYNVGDKVRIKSIDWWNYNNVNNINESFSYVKCKDWNFISDMKKYCGKILTIAEVHKEFNRYKMSEDNNLYSWTDEMIECKVEEETKSKFKVGDRVITDTNMKGKIIEVIEEDWYCVEFEPHNGIPQPNGVIPEESMALVEEEMKLEDGLLDDYEELTDRAFKGGYEKCKSDIELNGFKLPEGYQFVDENGNAINATKISLRKKKEVIPNLQLDSIRTVREYDTAHSRIWLEIYEDNPNLCIFTHLLVDEDHRQKGYGTKALEQAEIISKDLGCNTIHLKVKTDSWMYNWYLRSGYKFLTNAEDNYTWLTKSI